MVLRRNALAVVGDRKLEERPRVLPGDLDARVLRAGVLDCVAEEIHEHLLKRDLLGPDSRHVRRDADSRRLWRRDQLDHVVNESPCVDLLRLCLDPARAGILKNSVDERFHAMHAPAEELHLPLVLALERGAEVLLYPL